MLNITCFPSTSGSTRVLPVTLSLKGYWIFRQSRKTVEISLKSPKFLIFHALPVWTDSSGTFRLLFNTKYILFRQKQEIKSKLFPIGSKSLIFCELPVQNYYFRFLFYTSNIKIFQYDGNKSKNHQTSLKTLVFKVLPVWNRYFRFRFHTKVVEFC